MQVSKSWAVTITAFVCAILAPVVDGPLADYGIEISESDIEHFLYLMLGVGATGAAAKGGKKFIEKKTPQVVPVVPAAGPPKPPNTPNLSLIHI